MLTRAFVLALGAAAVAAPAFAHNIWMTPTATGAQVLYGDVIDPELADLKKIVSLELVGDAGRTDLRQGLAKAASRKHPVLRTRAFKAGQGQVLAVVYDNGFWLRLPQDKLETNTSSLLAPDGAEPHWTVKYGKTLLGRGSHARVLGSRLEFVPLADPYGLKAGQALRVRLLLEGKPYAGAKVAYTDGLAAVPDDKQPTAQTDKDGVIEIPFKPGPNLLTADLNTGAKHPQLAGKDHLYASLAFDTSH